MKEISKAIMISSIFFIFFSSFGAYNYFTLGEVSGSVDFETHWEIMRDFNSHQDYPHNYHYLFQFFSENKLEFYLVNLAIICLIIPLILFFALKTWWASLIYFVGINLPHLWLYGATYPQAFVFMLLIIYLLKRKNIFVFIVCGGLASLIHREGIYLFGLVLVAELVDFYLRKRLEGWVNRVKVYQAGLLANGSGVSVLAVQRLDTVGEYLFFLVTQISLPIWFYARRIVFEPFWLILAVIPLFLLHYDARIISLTGLALLFVATPEIVKSNHKKTILVFFLIYLAFFLLEFSVGTLSLLKR